MTQSCRSFGTSGNNGPVLSDDSGLIAPVIEYHRLHTQDGRMKQMLSLTLPALVCGLLAHPALAADCFADYKAKRDDPLRLHYGVAQLTGACDTASAQVELADRLAPQGWTLLNVMGVFGPDGLEERKADAGQYYLRY